MTINACTAPTGLQSLQQPNGNQSCDPNSAQAAMQKLLESLQQKSSCSGGSGTEDEKTTLLKRLLTQMGAQQQMSACGAQPCAA